MRSIPAATLLAVSVAILASCQSDMKAPGASNSPAEKAASWLTGSFSSAIQAQEDPEFLAIDLHMSRIWPQRHDGFWLYVEQAAESTPQRPYRQRVYRVFNLDDGQVRSEVFELPGDPLRFAGAWRDPALLGGLSPVELLPRDGCAITLAWKDGRFEGGTEGTGCESTLRGASFATSEVTLTEGLLKTWDRGWKSSGEQAWGSVSGPYIFVRAVARP